MTTFQLQKDLGEEIERILENMIFEDALGNQVKMKYYEQAFPKYRHKVKQGELMPEEEKGNKYPFCLVKYDSGELFPLENGRRGKHQVRTVLVFGIVDHSLENQGHQVLINIFQKVEEWFVKNPVLKGKYRWNEEDGMNWMINEEDWYPFFVGALEMTWDTFFVSKEEDKYA